MTAQPNPADLEFLLQLAYQGLAQTFTSLTARKGQYAAYLGFCARSHRNRAESRGIRSRRRATRGQAVQAIHDRRGRWRCIGDSTATEGPNLGIASRDLEQVVETVGVHGAGRRAGRGRRGGCHHGRLLHGVEDRHGDLLRGATRGTACWKAERVTSATGLLPALVTWPLIVAGMVFDGGAASGTSGMGAFDRSVPTGTSKAMVGLYAVVAPRFVIVIADTTTSKGLVDVSGQTMNVPSDPVVAARCTRSTVGSFGSGCSSSTSAP